MPARLRSVADRFSFHHFDGYSDVYNPDGKVQTVDYALPAEAGALDMVAAHSLFTHLHEPEARHYLAEIARVLKPGGRAVISLHVEPPAGQTYVQSHDRSDVDLDYFLAMASAVGLGCTRRSAWSTARPSWSSRSPSEP